MYKSKARPPGQKTNISALPQRGKLHIVSILSIAFFCSPVKGKHTISRDFEQFCIYLRMEKGPIPKQISIGPEFTNLLHSFT